MGKKITLPISGMTCAACANRIEKKLNKTEGISSANVNLTTEKANIELSDTDISLKKINEIIEKTGYSIKSGEVELKITGMTCAACSNRIEKKLNKTAGILNAVVNLATETAKIKFIDTVIDMKLHGLKSVVSFGSA